MPTVVERPTAPPIEAALLVPCVPPEEYATGDYTTFLLTHGANMTHYKRCVSRHAALAQAIEDAR